MVLSDKHHLLPVAWRLSREENTVLTAVVHSRKYQKAWDGRLEKFLTGEITDATFEEVRREAEEDEAIVLTDSRRWTETLSGYPRLFGVASPETSPQSNVAIGAWFDGEGFSGAHLLVDDLGAWTGGMGPRVASSTTLMRLDTVAPLFQGWLDQAADSLKSLGHRGLVKAEFGVGQRPEDGLQRGNLHLGWPMLHTHAFCADQPSLTRVLQGYEPLFPKRFVTCVSVTIPPWPNGGSKASEVEIIVPQEVLGNMWFHDMQVSGKVVSTAGLDGFVAVVRGSGDTLDMSRRVALTLASAVNVPERQFRLDAGGQVQQVLMNLEQLGVPF
jgi:hypothetical protein